MFDEQDGSNVSATESAASSASPSSSQGDTPGSPTDDEHISGMPALLSELDLQEGCYAFLQWLTQPALTPCESLVKARRVRSLSQLQPIKASLRFIFTILNAKEVTRTVDLEVLTRVDACQALYDVLSERGVGSGRFHAIFLLVKKVLTFLSSRESTTRRQFLPPSIYDSYLYVDGVCSDNSQRRKQESRNRAVLGVDMSQQLLREQQQLQQSTGGGAYGRAQGFSIPTQWSQPEEPTEVALAGGANAVSFHQPPPPSPVVAAKVLGTATFVRGRSASSPDNELSKAELKKVAQHCLANLHKCHASPPATDSSALGVRDRWYMALLVTAILSLGLAPRSQVLKQLRIGSTFSKQADDGRYWIRMLAEMSKNGRPTMFALPAELTPLVDHYLDVVRPRLLAYGAQRAEMTADSSSAAAAASSDHGYVFVKRDGSAPRGDFTGCTHLVTQQVLGRPIGPHAFRAAVITTFYEQGATQSDMNTLADIMCHCSRPSAKRGPRQAGRQSEWKGRTCEFDILEYRVRNDATKCVITSHLAALCLHLSSASRIRPDRPSGARLASAAPFRASTAG